jgi:hypothetical protein
MARRRAVFRTDRASAQRLAPQTDRKPLVTLQKMTLVHRVCSDPLLVGSTTNRFWRKCLTIRCSFRPALLYRPALWLTQM